ncbi:MAG: hypothetical protein HY791_05150 [Deltaproteobacteria bacterium]|nr:hypothetical protein [Deltaproteobacteria bacterium]
MSHFRSYEGQQLLVADGTVFAGEIETGRWSDWSAESGFPRVATIEDGAIVHQASWAAGNTLVERPSGEQEWTVRAPVYLPRYGHGTTVSECGFYELDIIAARIAPFPETKPTPFVLLIDDQPEAVIYRVRDGCALAISSPDESTDLSAVAVLGAHVAFAGFSGLMQLRSD